MQPQTLDELLAIEAIRRLKARYCLTCDAHDWAGYRACFTDDARITGDLPVDGAGERPVFTADEWPARVAATLLMASHHTVHQSIIDVTGPESARGVWAYTQRGFGWTGGYYLEEYARREGAWLISAMRIVAIHPHRDEDPHTAADSYSGVEPRWRDIAAHLTVGFDPAARG